MNKIFSLLTIARKAGKLEIGMDTVKDACKNKKAFCVLVASDISAKSLKEIKYVCDNENIKIFSLDATINDVWSSIGKKAGILGVLDKGFANKLSTMLEPMDNE